MDNMNWLLITLIGLWLIGVISFIVYLACVFVPSLYKQMEDAGLSEEEKKALLTKTMYPPRFNRD